MTDILVLFLFVLSGAASGWLGVDLLPVDTLKPVSYTHLRAHET